MMRLRRLIQPVGRWSLAWRLTTWYSLVTFVLLAVAISLMHLSLITHLDDEDELHFEQFQASIAEQLRGDPIDTGELMETLNNVVAHADARILLNQTVIAESKGMAQRLPTRLFPADAIMQRGREIISATGRPFRIIVREAHGRKGERYTIQMGLDHSGEFALLASYRRQSYLALGCWVFLSIASGHVVARRGLRPVAQVTQVIGRIRSSKLDERIDSRQFPAEMQVLTEQFNQMMQRLADSFARLTQFSANIAHELRTPINSLRGQLEVVLTRDRSPEEYRQAIEPALEDVSSLASVIETLLFIARAEDPQTQITFDDIDLETELAKVVEVFEPAAEDAQVSVKLNVASKLRARVNRDLFQRAIANLIENALQHSSPGGEIVISAASEDRGVELRVTDKGEGVSPDHLPFIFERFHRADRVRTRNSKGVGLGLAIVRSIAQLHDGTVSASSGMGEGTSIRLWFPAQST